jgi:signal transduction histidine kinase
VVPFPPQEPRLAAMLRDNRDSVAERLTELEWTADPRDPRALVRDRQKVRPRVELFIDSLIAGLGEGDWSLYSAAIATPTAEILKAGVRAASEMNDRALAIISVLIPYVSGADDRDELLIALFRTMQCLGGGLIAGHHQHLLDESRRLNDLKSLFMRLTSHELRGPLTVTRGYASLLADGDFGELPDPAAYISSASDSALSLINGLAEVASLVEGAGVLKVTLVRLGEVVDRAVGDVLPEAAAKGVSIEREVGAGTLEVDPERCVIAVRNLVANAVKYGARDAVVHVRASIAAGSHAEIEVEDQGPGIPGEELEMIFERYYRSTASRASDVPGSGLGLYIVKRIAQLHGGDVRVSSTPGQGSRFTLSIPAGSR